MPKKQTYIITLQTPRGMELPQVTHILEHDKSRFIPIENVHLFKENGGRFFITNSSSESWTVAQEVEGKRFNITSLSYQARLRWLSLVK